MDTTMAIRQRSWIWKGQERKAWVLEYRDGGGTRRLKTFRTKLEAIDYGATAHVDIKHGTHVADADSLTVSQAGKLWLATGKENGLERSTRDRNGQHLDLHITPFIGSTKLNKLTVSAVRDFKTALLTKGRSPALTRMVISSLGALVGEAQERGLTMRNPVRALRPKRGKTPKCHKARLAVGVEIPTPAEIRVLLTKAQGRWLAFFSVAALTGLRSSELRGLRWSDVDLGAATITVRQRADAWGEIGSPKSDGGYRTIPLPRIVVKALREWKLACPKGDAQLVFPNGKGQVESHQNIIQRAWHPLQVSAGMSVPKFDDKGKPIVDDDGQAVMGAKYSGLHALRHFFCSWCAARLQDGGLGPPAQDGAGPHGTQHAGHGAQIRALVGQVIAAGSTIRMRCRVTRKLGSIENSFHQLVPIRVSPWVCKKASQRPCAFVSSTLISAGVGISIPTVSLALWRFGVLLRLGRNPRTGLRIARPRSWASPTSAPRLEMTMRVSAGDRPLVRSVVLKSRTAEIVSLFSFVDPMKGEMCRSRCCSLRSRVLRSSPLSLPVASHRLPASRTVSDSASATWVPSLISTCAVAP